MVPKGIPGMPAATAGGGATIGVPPNAEPKGLASGAAAVQLGGTDKVPTVAALPRPAARVRSIRQHWHCYGQPHRYRRFVIS